MELTGYCCHLLGHGRAKGQTHCKTHHCSPVPKRAGHEHPSYGDAAAGANRFLFVQFNLFFFFWAEYSWRVVNYAAAGTACVRKECHVCEAVSAHSAKAVQTPRAS